MYRQLTREQRYAIYLGIQEGRTQTAIARQICVNRSTVSREIRRNSNRQGKYWWSIAHERIYEMIRADESGELKQHCRHRIKYRRHKKRKRPTKATNIPDRVSIHDRPGEADGKRFGDWEMDLILGKCQKSAILTLCERSRNYLIMERLPYVKNPDKVAEAVIRLLWPYRKNVLTITTDNGVEFRRHRTIAESLKTTVYFADSYAPWQKGTIENTNKLIRQYIPKGTDFRELTDEFIHSVQLKINRRPRE